MWLKVAIVIILVLLIISLASGLVFLVKDQGRTQRTQQALAIRVSLATLLVILITYGALTDQLRSQAPWSQPQTVPQKEREGK